MRRSTGLWRMALVLALVLMPLAAVARDPSPIVSADWLQANLTDPKLVVVDVRKVEDYKQGHIPGAVNVFYGSWALKKGALLNELPPVDDLLDMIGGAGIGKDSLVVLVGKTDKLPDQFDMTRVAWTLKYAGIDHTAILNGGQNLWVTEKKPLSTDMVRAKSTPYKGIVNGNLFVDKATVASKLGKALIVDTRGPAFFEGKEKLPFVARAGHIKGAVNLPVAGLYTPEGLYKGHVEIASLATQAVGNEAGKELILYCDTGKTCTSWAFVLTELLGYKDVKIYDGSFMEWAADPAAPVE